MVQTRTGGGRDNTPVRRPPPSPASDSSVRGNLSSGVDTPLLLSFSRSYSTPGTGLQVAASPRRIIRSLSRALNDTTASTVQGDLSSRVDTPLFVSGSQSLAASSTGGSPPGGLQGGRDLASALDEVADAFSGFSNGTGSQMSPVQLAAARQRVRDAADDYRREEVLNKLAASKTGMTGAQIGRGAVGAALGAAALYGLTQLLKKRGSDAKPASEDSKRRAPIVSRRPLRGRVSGRRGYKKGGVVKRKGVKKVVKKAGKR